MHEEQTYRGDEMEVKEVSLSEQMEADEDPAAKMEENEEFAGCVEAQEEESQQVRLNKKNSSKTLRLS